MKVDPYKTLMQEAAEEGIRLVNISNQLNQFSDQAVRFMQSNSQLTRDYRDEILETIEFSRNYANMIREKYRNSSMVQDTCRLILDLCKTLDEIQRSSRNIDLYEQWSL